MKVISMDDVNLSSKRVLIREDLNVPVKDGKVANDNRIRAALPTIEKALNAGAKVMIMSHLGRPVEGEFAPEFSLAPVADALAALLGRPVKLVSDYLEKPVELAANEVALLENVRFNAGEKKNDPVLAEKLASLCDVFVMDAFATAHRAQASTEGVIRKAPVACAGPLLMAELAALSRALKAPEHPLVALVGGSKVSTKLLLLEGLLEKVECLIVGGGIANTFLKASGAEVGKSLCEDDLVADAKRIMETAHRQHNDIPLPVDVVVASELSENAVAEVKEVSAVEKGDMILDIGPKTVELYGEILMRAKTVVWNGPVGAFEIDRFGEGTRELAEIIADSPAFSFAGGGDTVTAVQKYKVRDKMDYVSTAGGALLEFMEGRVLPAVAALEDRAR